MRGAMCTMAFLAAAPALAAQGAPVRNIPVVAPVATSVDTVIRALGALAVVPDQSVEIHDLTLTRDVGAFHFASGRLYALSPINGRTVAVAFVGAGTFAFHPDLTVEQERLADAFDGQRSVDLPITAAVLLFTDSTLEEVQAHGAFGAGGDPAAAHGAVKSAVGYLGGAEHRFFDSDLLSAILNGERSGYFSAYVEPTRGRPLMYFVDPELAEATSLYRADPGTGTFKNAEEITSEPAAGLPFATTRDVLRCAAVTHYAMDIRLPEATDGGVSFSADARMTVTTDQPVGPWVPFQVYYELKGDSAQWDSGGALPLFKGKDDPTIWVRLDGRLHASDVRKIRIWYHGSLIDRFGNWFFAKGTSLWYPLPLDGRNLATFDLTFHNPPQYPLATVGDRVDSASDGPHLVRTRWVVAQPIRNADFNLGLFSEYHAQMDGVPPLTLLFSDRNHIGGFLSTDGARKSVSQDILNALKFYTHEYGPPPVTHFYATEIPYPEGIAFPGMIELSASTFAWTATDGGDQLFRAHEVSHQWWGIGVDYASDRDRWLSEGFAEFSGLWYMQTALRDNKSYFKFLDRYRDDITSAVRGSAPTAVGSRASTSLHPLGYQTMVYEKGAWLLHMLRMLMLDTRTMTEDRFTQTMQDFYQTYHGGRASTADFQHVVERHIGIPMDWFFKEYYEGTALPAYQTAWKADAQPDGSYTVHLRVAASGVPADFENYIPVAIDLGGGRVAHLRIHAVGALSTLDVPGMPAKPRGVKFNDLDGVLAASWKSVGW